jgi:hypothetical protein
MQEPTGAWKTQRPDFRRLDPKITGLLVGSAMAPR